MILLLILKGKNVISCYCKHKIKLKLIAFQFAIFAALFLWGSGVYPQNYSVKSYTLSDGISTNYVHDATQDKEGRMWFANESGVSMYNGFKWINYGEKEGLQKTEYFSIKVDEKNVVWAVPLSLRMPVQFFSDNQWHCAKEIPSNIKNSRFCVSLAAFSEEGKTSLYIGTAEGLLLYRENRWYSITKKDGLISNNINQVKNVGGKLFISTNEGISVLQNGIIDNSLNKIINSPNKNILCVEANRLNENQMWIFGDRWIGEIVNRKFRCFANGNIFSTYPSQHSHAFLIFNENHTLFFGNEYKRFELNTKTKEIKALGLENGFCSVGANAAFLDREFNIWFPTYRGIDKVSRSRFQNYYKSDGLLDNEVSAILFVKNNFMIFGHGEGLTIFKNNKYKIISFHSLLTRKKFTSRIMDICRDSSNNIWIAASLLGVGKYTANGIKWIQPEMPNQINSVITDKKGVVWVGTDNGLYKISGDKLQLVVSKNEGFASTRKIFCDKDGTIYGATPGGLSVYKSNGHINVIKTTEPFFNNIYALCDYKNGTKLIGTINGLCLLQNNSIKEFVEGSFRINKKIFFINKDIEGNYWFGTNDGVILWNGNVEKKYSYEDGLAGREVNRSGFAVSADSSVWIGTEKGLSRYSLNAEKENTPIIPKFYSIEDAHGNSYDLTNDIEFSSSNDMLIFRFFVSSFVNENSIQYRILLKGYDNDWVEIGTNNFARYTSLDPGKYQLIVQARNINSEWSKPVFSGIITINKPFYFQLWFLFMVSFFFALLIYLCVILVAKIKYSRHLEKEVHLRTNELEESKEKLLKVKKIAHIGYIEWNIETNEMFWSGEACKIFGYAPGAVPVSLETTINLIHPEDREKVEEYFARLSDNSDQYDTELRMVQPVGRVVWVRVVGKFAKNENGKPVKMLSTFLDITNLKSAQFKLQEYSDKLQIVNAAKDKLFSIVAHDLKGPFQGLLGLSQVSVNDFDSLEKEEIRHYCTLINKLLNKQYNLVNNLLHWSKLQMSGLKINLQAIKLFDEVKDVVELFSEPASAKEIKIINKIEPDKIIFADAELISIVLRNLISNSIKYSNKKGEIVIASIEKDAFEEITVSDKGIGIDQDILPELFRSDIIHTTNGTGNEQGTGLGLILCSEIIEKHNGRIKVESISGHGSRFSVELPKMPLNEN